MSLSDDPDWGHKKEDDDFKIDSFLYDAMMMKPLNHTPKHISKENAYYEGENSIREEDYDTARYIFKKGADDFGCPLCATKYGMFVAENIGKESRYMPGTVIDYSIMADSGMGDYEIENYVENPDPQKYLQKGVDAHIPEAAWAYGIYLVMGKGMPKNGKKGEEYIKLAAKWGYAPAKEVIEEYKKESRRSRWGHMAYSSAETVSGAISESVCEKIANKLFGIFTQL